MDAKLQKKPKRSRRIIQTAHRPHKNYTFLLALRRATNMSCMPDCVHNKTYSH